MAARVKKQQKKNPSVAPGNDAFLTAEATGREVAKGDFTRVGTFSYDEIDPSKVGSDKEKP